MRNSRVSRKDPARSARVSVMRLAPQPGARRCWALIAVYLSCGTSWGTAVAQRSAKATPAPQAASAAANGAATVAPHAANQAKHRGTRPSAAAGLDAPTKAALEQASRLLNSDKREEIETGIQSLGLLGVEQAVPPLSARIRQGLPDELLELSIATLTALGQASAGPVLYELSAHRRPEMRRRAIEAIVATRPLDCEPKLLAALSDEDAQVRSAAAVALGEVGTSRSIDRLFAALEHGNSEASLAIGKLVAPASVPKFLQYLGRVPFHHMGPALARIIERRDIPEAAKLELIGRLEELGTAEVKGYLGELLAASGESLSPGVQRAVSRAVQQIGQ